MGGGAGGADPQPSLCPVDFGFVWMIVTQWAWPGVASTSDASPALGAGRQVTGSSPGHRGKA